MTVYPVAKINLGLNVVERRADGYHNLQTVFYPIPIKDSLEVQTASDGAATDHDCTLEVSNIRIDGDTQSNLVVRAYNLLKKDFPEMPRLHARLQKNIPTQAGMGGGSSDCAYMIRLLNDSCNLKMDETTMERYAASLGADCAFFIKGRPCYAEGIGDKMTPLQLDLGGWHIGVVKPDIPVPTKEAFAMITPHYPEKSPRDIVMQPVSTWAAELKNDFEDSVFPLHPEIRAVKEQLYQIGATYAAMSGSGSAVFGLFTEQPAMLEKNFPGMFTFASKL